MIFNFFDLFVCVCVCVCFSFSFFDRLCIHLVIYRFFWFGIFFKLFKLPEIKIVYESVALRPQCLIDEPVEFEKQPLEVQNFTEITKQD